MIFQGAGVALPARASSQCRLGAEGSAGALGIGFATLVRTSQQRGEQSREAR